MFTKVADPSQVAEARRLASSFAQRHGLAEARVARLALVVTELATNLLKHANGGEILARRFDDRDGSGIEVLALDRGAGMADVQRCVADGFSTAGSPGNGLGAILRQSDLVQIHSRPGQGTAIMARFVAEAPKTPLAVSIGAVMAPYPGEIVCGDQWAAVPSTRGHTVLLADGSGHGIEAERAAQTAVRVFHEYMNDPCEVLMERMHRALTPTRGAALAIARIDMAARVVRFVGVGNISAVLISGAERRGLMSYNGTAGHVAPRIREMTYPFGASPTVILHSDGVSPKWDLAAYPGLLGQHPSLIAGVLLRDFRRGRDDASVVVLRTML